MRSNHSGDGIEPIICKRKTRSSGDYALMWDIEKAEILFEASDSKGSIVNEGKRYSISAGGPLSRTWTLGLDGETVITAERHGIRSAILFDGTAKPVKLERKHMLGNQFRLTDPDGVVADFGPPKPVSGTSSIDVLDVEAEFLTLCFAFWLVTSIRRSSTGKL